MQGVDGTSVQGVEGTSVHGVVGTRLAPPRLTESKSLFRKNEGWGEESIEEVGDERAAGVPRRDGVATLLLINV